MEPGVWWGVILMLGKVPRARISVLPPQSSLRLCPTAPHGWYQVLPVLMLPVTHWAALGEGSKTGPSMQHSPEVTFPLQVFPSVRWDAPYLRRVFEEITSTKCPPRSGPHYPLIQARRVPVPHSEPNSATGNYVTLGTWFSISEPLCKFEPLRL